MKNKEKKSRFAEQMRMVGMEEIMPLVREKLALGGCAAIPVRGVSMLPTLKEGRDSVILSPIREALKKRDIVLYQRENGSCILHRIAEVGETYTCIGDAQFVFERGIASSQMIAVVAAIRRRKRLIHVRNPFYRMHCALWCASLPARHFLRRVKRKLQRMLSARK